MAKRQKKRDDQSETPAAHPQKAFVWPATAVALLVCTFAIIVAWGNTDGTKPARRTDKASEQEAEAWEEIQPGLMRKAKCHSKSYAPAVDGCTPARADCGARVLDGFLSRTEVDALRKIAERGMSMGGGAGGPTILDLQSGALSWEDKFIDVWVAFNVSKRKPYTRSDLAVYREVTERLAIEIKKTFEVDGIMLTSPTFFSRISADKPPRIPNDEYWHSHVDTLQYGSFVYTALVYLTEQGVDFEGGALCFDPIKQNQATKKVIPRAGRVVFFTSGYEHPHHVEQVTHGTRLALTVAFTCNHDAAITDFLGRATPDESAGSVESEV